MKTEIIISSKDAEHAMELIWAYLKRGGVSERDAALLRVYEALGEADRVVIETEEQRLEREAERAA